MLRVHRKALSETQVTASYEAKLANSKPVVQSLSATVQEDGEVGSHYSDPDFYGNEVPVLQLATVNLDVVDVDTDPSYINYDEDDASTSVYISSLPVSALMVLYLENGTEIKSTPMQVPQSSDGNYTIRVRPARNLYSSPQNSMFANFSYYAVDGVTGDRSLSTAMASLYVTAKNDPAVAYDANSTVFAGRKSIYPLKGTAVDGDSLIRAYISRLPTNGNLYFANETVAGDEPITLGAGSCSSFTLFFHRLYAP